METPRLSDWMSQLPSELSTVPLWEIAMPGECRLPQWTLVGFSVAVLPRWPADGVPFSFLKSHRSEVKAATLWPWKAIVSVF